MAGRMTKLGRMVGAERTVLRPYLDTRPAVVGYVNRSGQQSVSRPWGENLEIKKGAVTHVTASFVVSLMQFSWSLGQGNDSQRR